ncbi:MAG: sigma-54-dependent Fis family transcriptional regulator [Myxococcales bacterium]
MQQILIVDDEASMREFLEILLQKEGYAVQTANSAEDAFARIDASEFDLVLTDLKMPRGSGIDVLERVKASWPDTQVVLMTAYSTIETAIEALKKGAYDYVSKPFKLDELKVIIDKALDKRRLVVENERLRDALRERYSFGNIIGRSERIRQVFDLVERVARTRTSVLITGESGTGKELVAKALHYNSLRKDHPFVVINCGAIPENLMESELFGHVKGSFTGAIAHKKGLFEIAHGGTLFLDEVGELTLPLQVKLLRVLQERRIKPVGGVQESDVDVRIIAATNKELEEEIRTGRFREDLFYRLNVIQVRMPPLRERREDVPLIAAHFLQRFCDEMGKSILHIAPDALDALASYHFPGNVRELENIIERAVTFEMSDVLTIQSLPRSVAQQRESLPSLGADMEIPDEGCDLERMLADIEREFLMKALARTGGVKTDAARLLGISFRSIRYKLDKYNITDGDLERLA